MDYKLIDNDGFEKIFRNKSEARYYLANQYGTTILNIAEKNGGVIWKETKVTLKNQNIFAAIKKVQIELFDDTKK
jgi:hypothetical protein